MFDAQKHRGVRGFGLFDGSHNNIVRSASEGKVLKWLNKYDSNLILFHHRAPTSTINVKRAAHPFATKTYFGDNQYILIHNGHITNSRDLKKAHEALGITYQSQLQDGTFNDSESLLWDFALTIEGKQDKLKAYGGIAFICVKLHKGKLEKLYYARNNNPIKVQRDKTGIILSSEGEGEMAKSHELYTFNYNNKRLTSKYFHVPSYDESRYSKSWNNFPSQTRTLPSGERYHPPYSRTWNNTTNRFEYANPEDDPRFISYDSNGHAIFEDDEYDWAEYESYDDWCNRNRKHPLSRQQTIDEIADLYASDERDEFDDDAFAVRYNRVKDRVTAKSILKRYKRYLYKNKGVINDVYMAVEDDYNELWEFFTGEWDDVIVKELVLLERLMEFINNDKDYRDETSVSSLYKWRK